MMYGGGPRREERRGVEEGRGERSECEMKSACGVNRITEQILFRVSVRCL